MMHNCQNETPQRMVPRYPVDSCCGGDLVEFDEGPGFPTDKEMRPNPKQAYGDRKVALALFPSAGLIYGALAMQQGADKYGPFNWRVDPVELRTYFSAALRHLYAWFDGEDIDPESGVPHIGHAMACLAIIADATENNTYIDNRPCTGKAAALLRFFQRLPASVAP